MLPSSKKDRIHFFQNFDLPMLIVVVILTLFGILMIFSAIQVSGIQQTSRNHHYMQALWFFFGLIALFVIIFIHFRLYDFLAYPAYVTSLIILIALLFIGSKNGVSTQRWLNFGPVHFQPSEFAKIATILALAKFLASRKHGFDSLKSIISPTLIVLIPFGLILKQPDLGTSLVFIAIWIGMTFWAGLYKRYYIYLATPVITLICALLPHMFVELDFSFSFIYWVISLILAFAILYFSRAPLIDTIVIMLMNLVAGIGGPFIWNSLKEYQQKRIITFLNPNFDPLGAGYQIIQSKIAIGSGGILGKGLLDGTQKRLAFLPEQHTDFIFSVIGEELGFIVCLLVIFAFFFVFVRAILLAVETKDKFASLIIMGIVSMLVFHVIVNIGMAVGLMPVTGLPLPFLSYGGSSLLSNYICLGMILGIGTRRFEE